MKADARFHWPWFVVVVCRYGAAWDSDEHGKLANKFHACLAGSSLTLDIVSAPMRALIHQRTFGDPNLQDSSWSF